MDLKLSYSELTFILQVTAPFGLPEFKGHSLRGSLGYALRKTICTCGAMYGRKGSCKPDCPYRLLFETELEENAAKILRSGKDVPPPYILRMESSPQRNYQAGDIFRFSMVLVGRVTAYWTFFVDAIELVGETFLFGNDRKGIGTPPGAFRLRQVYSRNIEDGVNGLMYDAAAQFISPLPPQPLFTPTVRRIPETMTIHFLTPTRLIRKIDGRELVFRPQDWERPDTLVEAANLLQRRLYTLYALYCHEGYQEVLGILPYLAAPQLKVTKSCLRWIVNDRKENLNDGVMGTLSLRGELGALYPIFVVGQPFHLGKHITDGFGQYEVFR